MSDDKCEELEMTQPQVSLSSQISDGGIKGPDKGGGTGGGGGQGARAAGDTGEVEMARADDDAGKEDDNTTPTMLESSSNSDEGHTPEVVWTLGPHQEAEDESGDTPTKGHSSEDEKSDSAPNPSLEEEKKENNGRIKSAEKVSI